MTLRLKLAAAIVAIAALGAASAHAAVYYDAPAAIPEQADNTDYSVTFDAPAGVADLSFVLNGYASLDGANWYEDDFTLKLNGAEIFKGTFNLGGGGSDVVFLNLFNLNFANVSGNGTNVTWAGGQVNFSGPITLAAGSNTLTFAYAALPYNGGQNAGWQDMGDESWGVEQIRVASVPEPASWALMILGFASLGAMLRRARRLDALVKA